MESKHHFVLKKAQKERDQTRKKARKRARTKAAKAARYRQKRRGKTWVLQTQKPTTQVMVS